MNTYLFFVGRSIFHPARQHDAIDLSVKFRFQGRCWKGLPKLRGRRWHPTDQKPQPPPTRPRAKRRQRQQTNLRNPPSGQQTSSTSGGLTTQSTFNPTARIHQPKAKPKKRAAPQAAKKVRIKSLHGTPAGNLVVLQSQEGMNWSLH